MPAETVRQACPVCGAEVTLGSSSCPNCRTELCPCVPITEVALDFYNEALDRAHFGDRSGAIEKMQGAVAADPELADALIVLGKLLAQSGEVHDLQHALAYWDRARHLVLTEEQLRKVEQCTRAAGRRLHDNTSIAEQNRRRWTIAVAAVIVASCVLGGGAGFFLRWARPAPAVGASNSAGDRTRAMTAQSDTDGTTAPKGASPAVGHAAERHITAVTQPAGRLRSQGVAQSDLEKRTILAATALAAGVDPRAVNESKRRIQQSARAATHVGEPAKKGTDIRLPKTYIVKPGDSITGITIRFGRPSSQWPRLWQANRSVVRRPDKIMSGTVLRLPPEWRAPARIGAVRK